MLKKQNGQVIIIILLLMAVALTIGLSISSQTSSDINISTKLEESERAFAAAEAGIENTILSGGTSRTGNFPGNNSSYTVTVDFFTAGHENFIFPKSISQDDTHQLWLVGHDSATSEILESNYYLGSAITLYWGATNTPTTAATGCSASNTVPAIESTLVYKDNSGNFQIKKYAFDPDNSRAGCNHFNAASTGPYPDIPGKTFRYKATIDSFPADMNIPYALRLRFLYNSASEPLAVASQGGNFPSQGKQITSIGSVANTGIARKVEVFEAYQALPGIFDYVLFSGTNLTK